MKHKKHKINKEDKEVLKKMREFLVDICHGCFIQDGWPCGTCLMDVLGRLVDAQDAMYNEHNEDGIDRLNEVWRFILQARENDPIYQRMHSK